MIHSCRICSKIFCEKRNTVENCKECISFLYCDLKKLNKIIEEEKECSILNQLKQ